MIKRSRNLNRLSAAVLRVAAERLERWDDTFPCNAIYEVVGAPDGYVTGWTELRDALPEVRYFTKVLKPKHRTREERHLHGSVWYQDGPPTARIHDARILGLYLCALLLDEGFDPWEQPQK